MSRSDFLADKSKYCRNERRPGKLGDVRYFVCYGDFIKPEELPEGWGLYHFVKGKFYKIVESDRFYDDDLSLRHRRNTELLVNFIITEKTNIVFAKRVLENRERFRRTK